MQLNIDKDELKYKFEELRKNRMVLATISIIASFIICFLVVPEFTGALKGKITIITNNTNIEKGVQIEEKMLQEVEIGGFNVDKNIIKDKNEIIGKYAKVDIIKGTYLNNDMFKTEKKEMNDFIEKELTGLNRIISFKGKALNNTVAGKIEPNDIVSLIFVDVGTNKMCYIEDDMRYIKVVSLSTSKGQDYEALKKDDEDYEAEPDIVTVVCNERQAIKIAEMSEDAVITLALVYRPGKEQIANYFIDKQNKICEEIYSINDKEFNDNEEIKSIFDPNYIPQYRATKSETEIDNLFDNLLIASSSIIIDDLKFEDWYIDFINDDKNTDLHKEIMKYQKNTATKSEIATTSEIATKSNLLFDEEIKKWYEETYKATDSTIKEIYNQILISKQILKDEIHDWIYDENNDIYYLKIKDKNDNYLINTQFKGLYFDEKGLATIPPEYNKYLIWGMYDENIKQIYTDNELRELYKEFKIASLSYLSLEKASPSLVNEKQKNETTTKISIPKKIFRFFKSLFNKKK